jgi:hypothetical protein
METPERPPIINAVTEARRPYPKLSEAQKDRVCYEVRLYLAATAWIGSGRQARDFVYQAEQLELFPGSPDAGT